MTEDSKALFETSSCLGASIISLLHQSLYSDLFMVRMKQQQQKAEAQTLLQNPLVYSFQAVLALKPTHYSLFIFFCKLLNPMHVPAVCILNDIFNVIWRYSFSRQFTSHDKSHFQSLFQLSDKWLCDKAVKSWLRFVLKLCGCCFSSVKELTLDLTEDSPVLSLPVAESAGSLIQLLQKEGIVCLCSEFSFFFSGFDSSP